MVMKLLLLLLTCTTLLIFHPPGSGQIITTIAGTIGSPGYTGDGGPAVNARFNHPYGLAVDNTGNIYVFDQLNAVIRKIDLRGIISRFAGSGTAGYSGDGGPATSAKIGNHYSGNPAFDNAGNIYISDAGNHVIRKINTAGIITTVAGNGTFGYSGDGGPARSAQILPRDIAVDNAGNIYISDGQSRIRKVSTNGIITTIAGTGNFGFSGDGGPAIAANIDVSGIAVDNSGNIYFTDVNTDRIRKINTAGIISTIAGIGTEGYSGDGGPAISAALKEPYDVHADAFGNIYVADYNHTIRKINATGIISTVAGNGTAGYTGDGGLATSAQLDYPLSVWVDNCGNIYVTDFWNQHTVRKITYCTIPVITEPPPVYRKLFMPSGFTPNNDGKNDIFRIPPGSGLILHSLTIYDRLGKIVFYSNNINHGWDGKYRGSLLNPGVFVYQLSGEDPSGKIFLKGTILLSR